MGPYLTRLIVQHNLINTKKSVSRLSMNEAFKTASETESNNKFSYCLMLTNFKFS